LNDRIKKKKALIKISKQGSGKISYHKNGKNSMYLLHLDIDVGAITMDGDRLVSQWDDNTEPTLYGTGTNKPMWVDKK